MSGHSSTPVLLLGAMPDENVYSEGDYFETRFPYDESKATVWSVVSDYLDTKYGIGETVVDIGAGYGYFIENVDAEQKFAVDHSSYPLKRTTGDVDSLVGDVTEIPLEDAAADTVMLSNILEHLSTDEIQIALAEVKRVLSSEGTLFVVTPNFALAPRQYFDDFTHKTVLTHRSLADLLDLSGFTERDRIVRFLPFSSEGRLPVVKFLVRLYLHLPVSPFAGQSLFVVTPTDG